MPKPNPKPNPNPNPRFAAEWTTPPPLAGVQWAKRLFYRDHLNSDYRATRLAKFASYGAALVEFVAPLLVMLGPTLLASHLGAAEGEAARRLGLLALGAMHVYIVSVTLTTTLVLSPQPSTLSPQRSALSPQPSALNPPLCPTPTPVLAALRARRRVGTQLDLSSLPLLLPRRARPRRSRLDLACRRRVPRARPRLRRVGPARQHPSLGSGGPSRSPSAPPSPRPHSRPCPCPCPHPYSHPRPRPQSSCYKFWSGNYSGAFYFLSPRGKVRRNPNPNPNANHQTPSTSSARAARCALTLALTLGQP